MSTDSDHAQLKLVITGRVQGVFFRASAQQEAVALGLRGVARNRPDGAVEIIAEGPRLSLEQFLGWARVGPPRARVAEVELEWLAPTGKFGRFLVR